MGDDSPWSYPTDGESPAREVTVAPFMIERAPVTNDAFARFVRATGHTTDAERFGWSFVFGGLLPDDFPDTRGVVDAPWWRQVEGACWHSPEGPGSDVGGRGDHPVVHVSWNDAAAYAACVGGRLPAEAEWERAARGGTSTTFPWGDELEPGGRHRANVFQGVFPREDTAADGWAGTSPVGSFPPNGFGLVDAIGNVWEWTADRFAADRFVLKGGSYLCHASYCRRYRPAARMGSTPDSSTGNIGFRCAGAPFR
jgi:formylglycine-generating enzyme required for sulfatase activity